MNDSQRTQAHVAGARQTAFVGLAMLLLVGLSAVAGQPSLSSGIETSVAAFPDPAKIRAASSEPVVVDINLAGVVELTKVPGIGKSTAERIVEFRETHGKFERVDDLLKVKGIGEKSLKKLRPFLKAGRKG